MVIESDHVEKTAEFDLCQAATKVCAMCQAYDWLLPWNIPKDSDSKTDPISSDHTVLKGGDDGCDEVFDSGKVSMTHTPGLIHQKHYVGLNHCPACWGKKKRVINMCKMVTYTWSMEWHKKKRHLSYWGYYILIRSYYSITSSVTSKKVKLLRQFPIISIFVSLWLVDCDGELLEFSNSNST